MTDSAPPVHDHRFDPRRRRPGTIIWCLNEPCGAMRVWGKVTLRELTYDETITIIAHMLQATAIGQAMQIIHGPERGLERAREVLGYN